MDAIKVTKTLIVGTAAILILTNCMVHSGGGSSLSQAANGAFQFADLLDGLAGPTINDGTE